MGEGLLNGQWEWEIDANEMKRAVSEELRMEWCRLVLELIAAKRYSNSGKWVDLF